MGHRHVASVRCLLLRGRYKLENGVLFYTPASGKVVSQSSLGKVSGSVVTSDERLEFTIFTEYKTQSYNFRAEYLREMSQWMEGIERHVSS